MLPAGTDRRLTPFSGRIGHISLRDRFADLPLTGGEAARIALPLAPLLATPEGKIDRQLLYGDAVTVIDHQDGHAFVMAEKDGYCGWLPALSLAPPRRATHRVQSPATHLYPMPVVQAPPRHPLWLNALITVTSHEGAWAQTPEGFIPRSHLAALGEDAADPVTVAESLLHSPYLWGGNSAAGIDCSGLVQMAFHAAGHPCPADSDLQQTIGTEIPGGSPLRRGDLLFWKGHVALLAAPDQLLHANGYTMSVATEPLSEAISRIRAHYGHEIIARRRPLPLPSHR